MGKKIFILIIILSFFLCGCNKNKINLDKKYEIKEENVLNSENNKNNPTIDESKNLNIYTSNKFMYYCVKNIDMSKHKVDYVFCESPDELDIKYYYYDTQNMPDLFIYDEYNLINYSNNYISKINSGKVGIINAARGINTMSKFKKTKLIGKNNNSYYWNNIDNIKIVLLNVKNAIIERDPINRNYYQNNFDLVLKKLNDYDESFNKIFEKLKDYTFIVQGSYFQYLMGASDLNTVVVNGDVKNSNKLVNDFIDTQCSDKNKIIMLYYDNNFTNIYKEAISKYNIKTFKYNPIPKESNYDDVFEYEIKLLDCIIQECDLP